MTPVAMPKCQCIATSALAVFQFHGGVRMGNEDNRGGSSVRLVGLAVGIDFPVATSPVSVGFT